MYNSYYCIKKAILKVLNLIVYITSVIIPFSLFIQVIYRYIFKRPIPGIEELASASFIWLVIFGSAVMYSRNENIVVDVFIAKRSAETRRIVRIISNIIIMIILVILIYSCCIALPNQAVYKTVILKIPRSAHTKALIISFAMMIVFSIENIVKEFHGGKANVS
ncbi:MAG: TRAP transporter small permease [Lutisporaceae bacterium]